MAASRCPSGSDLIWRAVSRSLRAFTSQARTNSRFASSINQSSIPQNERLERRVDITKPLHLRSRFHENIHRRANPTQATMGALGSPHRRFVAIRDNDQQVQIAA